MDERDEAVGKPEVVTMIPFLDKDGRLGLKSEDPRLAKRQGSWVCIVDDDDDTARFEIGDFEAADGRTFRVTVVGAHSGGDACDWRKEGGVCRSESESAGSNLWFSVIATRTRSGQVPKNSPAIISGEFEVRHIGGTIRTRRSGGGGGGRSGG